MTATALELDHYRGTAAADLLDGVVNVYAMVYDVPPYKGDPFFSVDSFADRLRGALDMPGFETVTARLGGTMVGLVHGVTLPADRPWWTSLGDARPTAVREAANTGRVFWLRELMVLPDHTNQGIGRRLHDEVLAGRAEPWTTLTCIWDNQPARNAYLNWGYEVIGGRIKHAPESPEYDAMILPPAARRRQPTGQSKP